MTKQFHKNLNYMTLFVVLLIIGMIFFHKQFMQIAIANVYLNGIIIGTGIFGIGLCFVQMFKLLPEYKWLHKYTSGAKNIKIPPMLLRPIALMLRTNPKQISPDIMTHMLDTVIIRFDDSRESIKYITNTLIFLGLLGTFWGLILTVGGFSELISSLNFNDNNVLTNMQLGLSRPLSGMATAFTSSLLGLGFSLSVGFLGLQVQIAQNTIFRELEDYLSMRTKIQNNEEIVNFLPSLDFNTREITKTVARIEQNILN